ncbi:MAG TPA: histidine phosphatase family protein [Xanthobacteraceae bacterium]|jgi:broad specificity phosphatase PhoE
MTARLLLICHGSTDAVRRAAFPRDEPLDDRGKARAVELVEHLPSVDRCWTSPELRTRQTAEALALSASIQPMLRECDYGRWAGRTLSEIVADEPHAAESWLRDPAAAPHGGEPILDLVRRVAIWLADEQARGQRSIAVTHSTIIRAAIIHVMDAPAQSFWRIDIAPLSFTRLSSRNGRWNMISSGSRL